MAPVLWRNHIAGCIEWIDAQSCFIYVWIRFTKLENLAVGDGLETINYDRLDIVRETFLCDVFLFAGELLMNYMCVDVNVVVTSSFQHRQ